MLCSGSCHFDRRFNIGVAAGLVAEAAKAVGTFLPGCQDKDVVLFFFFDLVAMTLPAGTLPLWIGGVSPGSLMRVVVDPLHEPQSSGLGLAFPDGACSYLPSSILMATKHWALNSYQGFIDFLRYPCAGRKHHAPLMDARHT